VQSKYSIFSCSIAKSEIAPEKIGGAGQMDREDQCQMHRRRNYALRFGSLVYLLMEGPRHQEVSIQVKVFQTM
jgi:hypothetical protein